MKGGIELAWHSPLRFLLLPFSLIFSVLALARRKLYQTGLLSSESVGVPVVIVGNITAGGTGKTPLVAALAAELEKRGMHPGIVSRGYGGSNRKPSPVSASSDPSVSGDEPVLLASKGFPVWIGRARADAARQLLASCPDCDILISDDGLQHLALERDFEIAVVDGEKGFGNGLPLPAGPMREGISRLDSVDAIVVNSPGKAHLALPKAVPRFDMELHGNAFFNVDEPRVSATNFDGKRIHAIAGIGNPKRFFDHLQSLGIDFVSHPFPDHHPYVAQDLSFENCDIILMTEKDAIKCRGLAPGKCWFLPVKAEIDPQLVALLLNTLGI
ncbi:MAG: tetraacyldisaccharide 4'-kinase [Burkholderiales bacterium]|nr:tetraacyldisaccharide 4'-kinase [Burkholderiales bacterium]